MTNGKVVLPQSRHIKATELEEVPFKEHTLILHSYRAPAPFTGRPFDYSWDAYEDNEGAIGSPMTKRYWSETEIKQRGYY